MRTFHIHSFAAAIILSVLMMGMLGAFVVIPIVCINWTWNSVASYFSAIPFINGWQAALLYCAFACIFYLLGLVQIEFKTGTID